VALIKCPECGTEISDKAKQCIKCGCPIKAEVEPINKEMDKAAQEWNNTPRNKRKWLIKCQHCGYVGPGKRSYNEALGCLLFILFIIPYIIYYYAVGGSNKMKCPACGSEAIKPLEKELQETGRFE